MVFTISRNAAYVIGHLLSSGIVSIVAQFMSSKFAACVLNVLIMFDVVTAYYNNNSFLNKLFYNEKYKNYAILFVIS